MKTEDDRLAKEILVKWHKSERRHCKESANKCKCVAGFTATAVLMIVVGIKLSDWAVIATLIIMTAFAWSNARACCIYQALFQDMDKMSEALQKEQTDAEKS
jgi:hypothetical protein